MKKFVGLTMLLAFMLAFLSGCACEEDDVIDELPNNVPNEVVGGVTEDPDDPPEDVVLGGRLHEPRDFGGRTLLVGAWWDEAIVSLAWGEEPDRATAANYYVARRIWDNARRVEEVFNVNFDIRIVSYDDFLPTLTASVMAGEPFADIVMLS
ncbi:MAG: hypothetical protein FWF80_01260, partial [Defluviitaleaceae bacterium]|nr:hypothetical protein [Defluviitaleaceae bacterium]